MKITLKTGLAAAALLLASATGAFAAPFLQASSTESQFSADGKPKVVTMNSTDATSGITNDGGVVVVPEDGTYFLMAAAQIGGKSKGNVRLWMQINGADVGNSNTEQSVLDPAFTAVLVCQGLATLKKGDKVVAAFSSTAPDVGLVVSSPAGEPVVPSIIFSAFKVD
jgi:hypothetical protein